MGKRHQSWSKQNQNRAKIEGETMEYIGYIKYQGPNIKDGLFGARDAATALNGFDEVFQYFLSKEEPEFAKLNYDLPVKIEEGSWEILTPENIEHLMYVAAGSGIGFCTLKKYFETIADVAGKDGLLQTGPAKDITATFRKTYQTILWVIKLVSHMKCFKKKYEHAKFTDSDQFVIITNDEGEQLKVPIAVLFLMEKCPTALFGKLASLVSPSQELEIGVKNGNQVETAKITEATRRIFFADDDDEENILPELVDGETVTLTGVVTRTNESENSLGFAYNDHVLTCKPLSDRTLADFKTALISQNHKHLYVPQVVMTGVVERKNQAGQHKDRVRIFFSNLDAEDAPEDENLQTDMFKGETL